MPLVMRAGGGMPQLARPRAAQRYKSGTGPTISIWFRSAIAPSMSGVATPLASAAASSSKNATIAAGEKRLSFFRPSGNDLELRSTAYEAMTLAKRRDSLV